MQRQIKEIFTMNKSIDGAGVHLNRIFGYHDIPKLDPFLLLDYFDSYEPKDYIKGFPWHPHRGIETVTYLLDGTIIHEDSLGNGGIIGPGDCQWMTAGSGILHQEMPQASEHMHGVQLWVNLPRDLKMSPPTYREIKADRVPLVEETGMQVRIIAGSYADVEGCVSGIAAAPLFLDITMEKGKSFSLKTPEAFVYFMLVISGKMGDLENGMGALYESGTLLQIEAEENVRLILIGGQPLEEPIAWGGPIVMNTKDELNQAFIELDEGTFIK